MFLIYLMIGVFLAIGPVALVAVLSANLENKILIFSSVVLMVGLGAIGLTTFIFTMFGEYNSVFEFIALFFSNYLWMLEL